MRAGINVICVKMILTCDVTDWDCKVRNGCNEGNIPFGNEIYPRDVCLDLDFALSFSSLFYILLHNRD